jgi:hypothetical protein
MIDRIQIIRVESFISMVLAEAEAEAAQTL